MRVIENKLHDMLLQVLTYIRYSSILATENKTVGAALAGRK